MKHGTIFTTNDVKIYPLHQRKTNVNSFNQGKFSATWFFAMYNIKLVISNTCIKLKETAWVEICCCELQLM
jgi:hypothetical protein